MDTIITVKEARKLLGVGYAEVDDAVIRQIIEELDFMSDLAFSQSRKEVVPKYTVGSFNETNNRGE